MKKYEFTGVAYVAHPFDGKKLNIANGELHEMQKDD